MCLNAETLRSAKRSAKLRTRSSPSPPVRTNSLYFTTIIMDSSVDAIATERQMLAKKLRLELKEWEQSFAAAHQGRKAGREDIKQHPEIG